MSGRFFAISLVAIAGLLLAGCGVGVPGLVTGTTSEQPTAAALPGVEVVAEGEQLQYDDPEPRFLVITNPQGWAEFWKTYMPESEPAPEVDFEQSLVLVGIQGAKNTGGYDIRFTGLEVSGDEMRVIVAMEEPDPGAAVEMVLTQPYIAVEVAADRLPSGEATTFVFETGGGEELEQVKMAFAQNRDIEPKEPKPTEPGMVASEVFAGAEVIAEGEHLRYEDAEPRFFALTSQQALEEFWQAFRPEAGAVPALDFGESFVLAGIQGAKNSGGYDIRFTSLEQSGDEVRVVTEMVEPPADEPVEMTFTQPYIVIRVDKDQLSSRGTLTFVFQAADGELLEQVPATVE